MFVWLEKVNSGKFATPGNLKVAQSCRTSCYNLMRVYFLWIMDTHAECVNSFAEKVKKKKSMYMNLCLK